MHIENTKMMDREKIWFFRTVKETVENSALKALTWDNIREKAVLLYCLSFVQKGSSAFHLYTNTWALFLIRNYLERKGSGRVVFEV